MKAIVIIVTAFAFALALALVGQFTSAEDKEKAPGSVVSSENAQAVEKEKPAAIPDATVVVHERALNGFLAAVGPMSGKGKFAGTAGMGKIEYTWTVRNPRIEISKGRAQFAADASVKAGPINYKSPANGTVEVKYTKETNRISVKVLKANFEVYTKLFNKKIHIANVDLSRFYRPEFEFAGPQPIQESVEVDLSDGGKKTIYISTKDQNMTLEDNQIVVTSNLVFSDQPPAKPAAPAAQEKGGESAPQGEQPK